MLCLSDSDYIIKLAEFDLLDETLGLFGLARSDVRVLPELARVLQGQHIFTKHTREAVQRASKFVKGLKTVEKIDKQEQILLHSARAIYRNRPIAVHGGEAILFSATKFIADYVVATGDKRSLRALAAATSCKSIHDRLRGKVLCLEQTLLKLIDKHGYKLIFERVAPMCSCDDCVQQAFADGKASQTEADCREWLTGFVDELRLETNGLLIP